MQPFLPRVSQRHLRNTLSSTTLDLQQIGLLFTGRPKGFKNFERKSKKQKDNENKEKSKAEKEKNKKKEEKIKEQELKQRQEREKQQKEKQEQIQKQMQEELNKFKKVFNRQQNDKPPTRKPRQPQKEEKDNEEDEQEDKQENKKGTGPDENPKKSNRLIYFLIFYISYTLMYQYLSGDEQHSQDQEVTINDFENKYLANGLIHSIIIMKKHVGPEFTVKFMIEEDWFHFPISDFEHFLNELDLYQRKRGVVNPEEMIKVSFVNTVREDSLQELASRKYKHIFKMFLMAGLTVMGMIFYKRVRSNVNLAKRRGGGINMMKKDKPLDKKSLLIDPKTIDVTFSDVVGMDEAKKEISEFVHFLKHPEKYKRLGASIPRGALMTGPPGTGKTMLAKACAKESGVPFIYISGSEFVEMYVGVGASRVRNLFEIAKKEKSCIIFIDELDAIGKKRSSASNFGSGNSEKENTLNQLLVEMDGFTTEENIVIFGATNLKSSLDPALLRPGRFDRKIDVELPDIEGRQHIFKVHLKKIKVGKELTLDDYARRLATLTPGFSGAEIENICNEAAIYAARTSKDRVRSHEFEMAVERVIGGLEKKRLSSENERRTVAVHESGHAVVSWFLEGGLPLLKITIIPRSKGALGYAQYLPNESQLDRRQDMVDMLCSALGGRIAEEVFFGRVTTGAQDDLEKVNNLAHQIVSKFGMGSDGLPLFYTEDDYGNKNYSDQTSREIDLQKLELIKECTAIARKLIEKHRDHIKELSETLLKKETIDFKVVSEVLGPRPFKPREGFRKFLEEISAEYEVKEQMAV